MLNKANIKQSPFRQNKMRMQPIISHMNDKQNVLFIRTVT